MMDKVDRFGLCPVFIRSKLNGKELKYFTGEKCLPDDFDSLNHTLKI
jgi:hypothetical protein